MDDTVVRTRVQIRGLGNINLVLLVREECRIGLWELERRYIGRGLSHCVRMEIDVHISRQLSAYSKSASRK